MGKSLKAPELYASQLVDLGYGHPLWYPEPTKDGVIEIGDIGYIDDGSFRRLFNALCDEKDPVNEAGVPSGFVRLRFPDTLRHRKSGIVEPGTPLTSNSVQIHKVELGGQIPAGPVSAGGGYSFSSDKKRGAVAMFEDGGVQETVSRSTAFQEYIYRHHASWYDFACLRGLDVKAEEIVLVSGWFKTSGWALATYASRENSNEFSLSASASGIASGKVCFSFKEKNRVGLQKRAGPHPSVASTIKKSSIDEKESQHPSDQCLFLQYYKCQTRALGPTTIRNPQNLRRKDMEETVANGCFCAPFSGPVGWMKRHFGGCCRDVEMEDDKPVSSERSLENPISALLDYMLETSPEGLAITSHADLYDLFRGIPWPEDVSAYLKENRPKIKVGPYGAQLDTDALLSTDTRTPPQPSKGRSRSPSRPSRKNTTLSMNIPDLNIQLIPPESGTLDETGRLLNTPLTSSSISDGLPTTPYSLHGTTPSVPDATLQPSRLLIPENAVPSTPSSEFTNSETGDSSFRGPWSPTTTLSHTYDNRSTKAAYKRSDRGPPLMSSRSKHSQYSSSSY